MSTRAELPVGFGPLYLLLMWALSTMTLWAFAFAHIPGATPEWLLRAQSVCFGTNETGLPDTYGWAVLILAPLSMLAAIVVSFSSEISVGIPELARKKIWRSFTVLVLGFFLAETVWIGKRITEGVKAASVSYESFSKESLSEHYPRLGKSPPSFSLVDEGGNLITLETFRGKTVFLSFFFAHCKTVCPFLVKTVRSAAQKIPERAEVVLITLDPWRDTPSSLPSLAREWNLQENEHVLSGAVENVEKVIKDFDMPIQRDAKSGDITHPSLVYVISPEGKIEYGFNNPSLSWLLDAEARLKVL